MNFNRFRFFIPIVIGISFSLFTLFSCHGNSSASKDRDNGQGDSIQTIKHVIAPKTLYPKGQITDTIKCAGNPEQKYALYLPTSYDSSKKFPVIYFFDPHGAGDLPLEIYKDLADKYGYILAGTYNSKNGMQWDAAHKAAISFMRDSYERLSIDNNRIYIFGFSGGGKIASSVAIADGGIAGVVVCGSGFPERHPPMPAPFSCLTIVGNKDFNYVQAEQLDKLLDTTTINHQLISFNGKHQWPPKDIVEQAFQWLSLNAMRANYTPKNPEIINAVKQNLEKDIDKSQRMKDKPNEYLAIKKLMNFLRNVTDMGKYATQLQELEGSAPVKQYLKDKQTFEVQELMEQEEFINNLKKRDNEWWENEVSGMKERIKKDSNSPTSLVEQRILGLLSLVTYMNASGAFNARQYTMSERFVSLYALVDPQNPEHSYLQACLDMKDNKKENALKNLDEAEKLGFNDLSRLQQDTNFISLHSSPQFKEIVKKIGDKPSKLDLTR